MAEIWKPISKYEGYDVSNQGRVRSYHIIGSTHIAETPQRYLRPSSTPQGYLAVNLRADGLTYHMRIAPLVMLTFVGQCPEGLEVCHNDDDPQNNKLENLRYDTRTGNLADMSSTKRYGRNRILTDEQITEIRKRYANDTTLTCRQLGLEYGVSDGIIQHACSGKGSPHLSGPTGTRRLSPETIRTILARLEHQTAASLSREYGIHESTISLWRSGKRRKA